MMKRYREAEQHFGQALRAPKTYQPKVETDYTRMAHAKKAESNLAGLGMSVLVVGLLAVVFAFVGTIL